MCTRSIVAWLGLVCVSKALCPSVILLAYLVSQSNTVWKRAQLVHTGQHVSAMLVPPACTWPLSLPTVGGGGIPQLVSGGNGIDDELGPNHISSRRPASSN